MRDYTRRLQVSVTGRWYLAMTIAIGVTAITTGNNAIYAIESLLLSGLILSGILSEQVIRSVDVEIKSGSAVAGTSKLNTDRIIATNTKNQRLYCIEIGEWSDGSFLPLAWISYLNPHESKILDSKRLYPRRGSYGLNPIGIATRFPFGFARKIRFENQSGQRIVWPSLQDTTLRSRSNQHGSSHPQNEVRAMLPDDDYRSIIWTLSDKGAGLVVRANQHETEAPSAILDARGPVGPQFESEVSKAALIFYKLEESQGCTLTIINSKKTHTFRGRSSILNQLGLVEAELPANKTVDSPKATHDA
jgi:uncharacterized protein (DUF58 family)